MCGCNGLILNRRLGLAVGILECLAAALADVVLVVACLVAGGFLRFYLLQLMRDFCDGLILNRRLGLAVGILKCLTALLADIVLVVACLVAGGFLCFYLFQLVLDAFLGVRIGFRSKGSRCRVRTLTAVVRLRRKGNFHLVGIGRIIRLAVCIGQQVKCLALAGVAAHVCLTGKVLRPLEVNITALIRVCFCIALRQRLLRVLTNRADISSTGVVLAAALVLGIIGLFRLDVVMLQRSAFVILAGIRLDCAADFAALLGITIASAGRVNLNLNIIMLALQVAHRDAVNDIRRPHELLIIVGFLLIAHLLHHAAIVTVLAIVNIICIVVGLLKLIAVVTILVAVFNVCLIAPARAGDKRIVRSQRNDQLAILNGHRRNRRILYVQIRIVRAVCNGGQRVADHGYRLITRRTNSVVLLDLRYRTALGVIGIDAVCNIEVEQVVRCIVVRADLNRRILLLVLLLQGVHLGQLLVVHHLAGLRIPNRNTSDIVVVIIVVVQVRGEVDINRINAGVLLVVRCRTVVRYQSKLRIALHRIAAGIGIVSGSRLRPALAVIAAVLTDLIQQIRGIVQIIPCAVVIRHIRLGKRKPRVLIGLVRADGAILRAVVQRVQRRIVAVKHLACAGVRNQEIDMIQVTVQLNAVTHHALNPNIVIGRVNVVPLTIDLNRTPVMLRGKILVGFTIHRDIRIEVDLNAVHHCIGVLRVVNVLVLVVLLVVVVDFLKGLPGAISVLINLRECILHQIVVRVGITHADADVAQRRTQDTELLTFPQIQNILCNAVCLCLQFFLCYISGCDIIRILLL